MSKLTSNGINKFERKVSEKSSAKERKGLTLFISNGDMSDIIKIRNILEDLSVLIDGVAETVKNEKKTRRLISWSFVSTFSRFISTASDFVSRKRYKWKRS